MHTAHAATASSDTVRRVVRRVIVLAPGAAVIAPTGTSRELAAYLAATPWCDADHPCIRALSDELTRGLATQAEKAAALFAWVRDAVPYTLGDWNWRASETLALRRGTCSNKANLLVALARAAGIPAGFHVMSIRTRHYFGVGLIPMIRRVVRGESVHVYAAMHLGGRWVKCDPTDDAPLCRSIVKILPHAHLVEFNGVDDAVHGFAPDAILGDRGTLASLDDLLSRKPGFSASAQRVFGHFIRYMREHGGRYSLDDADCQARIERDFRAWLTRHHADDLADLTADETRAAA